MMKECGLNVVRVGESAWGLFEPQEGVFDFKWMDRIVDKMYAAGIKVILGTPTYSIPAWMAEKHPEVLAVYSGVEKLIMVLDKIWILQILLIFFIVNALSVGCWNIMLRILVLLAIK